MGLVITIGYTEYGKLWNDSAMQCLQNKLVDYLEKASIYTPSCMELDQFAFDSHPSCYTQGKYSFCKLKAKDFYNILKVIRVKDIISKKGIKQVLKTAKMCIKKKFKFSKLRKSEVNLSFVQDLRALNSLIKKIKLELEEKSYIR